MREFMSKNIYILYEIKLCWQYQFAYKRMLVPKKVVCVRINDYIVIEVNSKKV